jgi:hypothetical protein
MNTRAWLGLGAYLWGLGIPGPRELVLLALVLLVLYGRSGLQVARSGGRVVPWWLSPVRRTSVRGAQARANRAPQSPASTLLSWRRDRFFWFLAIIAATAVGAWIVTRTLIVAAPKLSD